MSIALDAMGGDHAPREIVLGAVEAASLMRSDILLVGDPSKIQPHLPGGVPPNLQIHPAMEVVGMDEKPTEALRKKRDSSLMVGIDLVKQGVADAFVSAGNTGACTAASLLAWRQIEGIHRPAIASFIPNRHGGFLLLDAGASPDIDPSNLVEFAIMGRAYAEKVMGRSNPRVHLVNIGEEQSKGNAFAKSAYPLLAKHDWFAGNVEGKDMFARPCDVVVCDAFVGNVVLKTCEGVAEFILGSIRDSLPPDKLRQLLFLPMRKLLAPLKKTLDYAEHGGSPLLGLNGLTIICHGRSSAKAIKNALLLTQKAIDSRLVDSIRESVCKELGGKHG
ncbi:MAG: phosphate acyltransferase PlsX [Fimbriimonadaceae bacterium]